MLNGVELIMMEQKKRWYSSYFLPKFSANDASEIYIFSLYFFVYLLPFNANWFPLFRSILLCYKTTYHIYLITLHSFHVTRIGPKQSTYDKRYPTSTYPQTYPRQCTVTQHRQGLNNAVVIRSFLYSVIAMPTISGRLQLKPFTTGMINRRKLVWLVQCKKERWCLKKSH